MKAEPVAVPVKAIAAKPVAALSTKGWSVRGYHHGAAVLQSRLGYREVSPGDYLPGVGRVLSIKRRGHRWLVFTSSGVIG